MATPRPSSQSTAISDYLDDIPAIIEYIWCGESVGLKLGRHTLVKTPPAIQHTWTNGDDVNITLATEFYSKKVIVRRVSKRVLSGVRPKFVLHSINGAPVRMDNFNEMMVVLKTGHAAGIPQVLEFQPNPMPVMVIYVPEGGVLDHAGVTTEYELMTINHVNVTYLTLDQIGRMLHECTKPCHLTFGWTLPIDSSCDVPLAMLTDDATVSV
ncbi:hypothetical protein H310_07793 [Aphanomyces invadans]|nr:hypothetical protein H310_07793 [Aphanomyces invadans]ETV99739.1 hypothetical protein H310_07793 [Aphanomyces invadans]|eukprot:XP_008871515.1 hypothetical protein H310_07793 [Aphanomyces invadans]